MLKLDQISLKPILVAILIQLLVVCQSQSNFFTTEASQISQISKIFQLDIYQTRQSEGQSEGVHQNQQQKQIQGQDSKLQISSDFDFLFDYQFTGKYQIDQKLILRDSKLFNYLESRQGKISIQFYEDLTEFELEYAIQIVLFDPKYDDQKLIVFVIKSGQIANKTWTKTNMKLLYSQFYNQRPIDQLSEQNINFTLTVSNTQNRNPEQVTIQIKMQGDQQISFILFSATLQYNQDLQQTLWYCLFASAVSSIQIACTALLIKQIINQEAFISYKFSLTTITICTIFDFYQMLIYIQLIVDISNSSMLFLIPGLLYILMFLALDTPLIFLVWKGHYMRRGVRGPRALRKQLLIYYGQLYGTMFTYMFANYFFYFSGWYTVVQSLFILPQIIRNIRIGNKSIFPPLYVFGYLGIRILLPIYNRLCPENRFHLVPMVGVVVGLCIMYILQIMLMYFQYRLKPGFFIPKQFQPKYFNYIKKIVRNQNNSQLDCTICLLGIFQKTETRTLVLNQSGINQSQLFQNEAQVMQTPCNHNFHEECLSKWMQVKLECPTCRADLPPLF